MFCRVDSVLNTNHYDQLFCKEYHYERECF
nr:MAG TPA: hypothetical protein [Caudoviricetes sp.]